MSLLLTSFVALALRPQSSGLEVVPFRTTENAIIVDAKVNGRNVTCMFDTGFSGSVVLNDSVDVGKPTGKMKLRDFVGELTAETVPLKSLQIGNKLVHSNEDKIVKQAADFSAGYGTHVDGIMGLGTVMNSVTEINFQKKEFIFHPETDDISKRVPDNERTFLAKMLPIGSNSIELYATTGDGKTMTLALDTGNAFYATTHKDVLERVGIWKENAPAKFTRQSGVASGAVESWSMKMPPLKIFGVPVGRTVWDIIDLPSSTAEGDGTVGFGFLSNFNITIDYARRRVWLERWKTPVENDEPGDVGISAGYSPIEKRTIIVLVAPGSPAAEAGIKVGDEILSVDGADVERGTFARMRKLLEGPVDSSIKLAISRDGALKRFDLKRRSLVNVSG